MVPDDELPSVPELRAWLRRRGRRDQMYEVVVGTRPPPTTHDTYAFRELADGSITSETWMWGRLLESGPAYEDRAAMIRAHLPDDWAPETRWTSLHARLATRRRRRQERRRREQQRRRTLRAGRREARRRQREWERSRRR